MSEKERIINIAVIAHVDAGKSTLVDAFLRQSDVFRSNEEVVDCVMDSNDLERERGITIYSKNCSVIHKGVKINIVDTPGHADFSSEVERIIKTVDTVILLVDSSEGPMPQTRFVLSKALEYGLKPILLINKIDKKDQRAQEVVDEVYELFLDLNATDEQLDFPILYGIAREGIVQYDMETPSDNIEPLFETILSHCEPYPDLDEEPLQMQVSALAYDEYIGRLGIGRIYQGTLHAQQPIAVCDDKGNVRNKQTSQIFVYKGLTRVSVEEAHSGDIVVVAGIPGRYRHDFGIHVLYPADPAAGNERRGRAQSHIGERNIAHGAAGSHLSGKAAVVLGHVQVVDVVASAVKDSAETAAVAAVAVDKSLVLLFDRPTEFGIVRHVAVVQIKVRKFRIERLPRHVNIVP